MGVIFAVNQANPITLQSWEAAGSRWWGGGGGKGGRM